MRYVIIVRGIFGSVLMFYMPFLHSFSPPLPFAELKQVPQAYTESRWTRQLRSVDTRQNCA